MAQDKMKIEEKLVVIIVRGRKLEDVIELEQKIEVQVEEKVNEEVD